ncbi:hypothetical protein ACIQAC_24495 [Streptomyces sp. NPDC088387]|uniref:hypothetical protein n=1 Tax=Streptomyces sp. NPDC088387 TaxID=3365859 RepID=UPI0038171249
MGSWHVTLGTGLLAVAAFTAPAAHAADGAVSISPSSPAPGGEIALRVTGCDGTTATAASPAFVSEARLTGADGTLTGDTMIRSSLKSGAYDVTITCADRTARGSIKVSGSSAEPSAPASPTAPVHAGGGGTAAHLATADDADSEGPGTAHAITGLLLAGAAAVAVILRGSRKSRRTQ